ncbi:MAG: hypothetical protein WCE80_08130, partial [Acidimicrobiia bacterium]
IGVSDGREIESEVPEVPEALLGNGSIGGFQWAVFAGRESKSSSTRRPCIKVATGEGLVAEYDSTARTCGSLGKKPPSLIISSGKGVKTRTVLGMAFPRRVRSVRLWMEGMKSRRIRLRRLNAKQASFAGLIRFRFAAQAIAGRFCLRRFATYDASGNPLEISPRMRCSWGFEHESRLPRAGHFPSF